MSLTVCLVNYTFSEISDKSTIEYSWVEVEVAAIGYERAYYKYSDKCVEQIEFPFFIVKNWFETIEESLFSEQIRKDPDIVPEDYANQEYYKPDKNEAYQNDQQNKWQKPNSVLQLVGPDREQNQGKDGEYDCEHHPFLRLSCIEAETCVFFICTWRLGRL